MNHIPAVSRLSKPPLLRLLLQTAICLVATDLLTSASAEEEPINYDESRVKAYALPDPLKTEDGTVIGAIGASGSSVDNDHAVAAAGAAGVK